MTWGYVAAGAATVVSGAISAKSADKGSKAQKKAADKQIDFARESRDIELGRTQPYVEAGHSALRALMSLTGLSAPAGSTAAPVASPETPGVLNTALTTVTPDRSPIMRGSMFNHRAEGGPVIEGEYYTVNEEGPENIYSGGVIKRRPMPQMIEGRDGYVQPNVEPRFLGGLILKNDPLTKGAFKGGKRKRSQRLSALEEQMAGMQNQQTTGSSLGPTPAANTTAINPETGFPYENPGGVEGQYNFQTDPGYQFRVEEGIRTADRSASARGGLLSGGFGRQLIRYGQDYASNEYSNVYNRIANIAGLGQTANAQANQSSMFGTSLINQATSDSGYARASGYLGQGNAWANAASQLGQLPWANIFNRGGTAPPGTVDSQGYGGALMGPPRQ